MEYEKQTMLELDKTAIPAKAAELAKEGYRLVQICCTTTDVFTITYSFDKEYSFLNVRVTIPRENPSIPSITESYLAGFTYENELHDLFGIKVEGLKLDFNGHFYKLSQKTPFASAPATPVSKPDTTPKGAQ
jgi:ech hydrogenase subunit D